jgi:hypothetical protein
MHISEHYRDYPKKTLIVLVNHEHARILSAFEREVEEIVHLEEIPDLPEEGVPGTPSAVAADIDATKKESRHVLYKRLEKKLTILLSDEHEAIILCAPEAKKNEIVEAMHPDVMNAVSDVVPKNLASLQLDQVIRILQEKREV